MWAACSSGLGGLEAWGLMAPVEFLSMGHYNSLVFAHLVEVDGFLAFQVTALSLMVYLLEVPSRQRTPGSFVPWRF